MASDALPAELDSLAYSARVRAAVEFGRSSRTDPKAAATLRAWRSGGFVHRLLAVHACHGSRDAATLADLASDPSRTVAHTAIRALQSVGDDETLFTVLRKLPPRQAAACLFRLRARHSKVVDRFLGELAAASEDAVWPLVPLGSPAIMDRYLDVGAERGGELFWSRLATLHPMRAVGELVGRLDAATAPDGLLFTGVRAVIAVLTDNDPDAALVVVRAFQKHVPFNSIPLQSLVVHRPVEVADLVLGTTDPTPVSFTGITHRLDVGRIVALFRHRPYCLGAPEVWLAKLPATDRAAAYRELAPAWTSQDGLVTAGILYRLPADLRCAEARRVIALPVLATRPFERLGYAGLLPWVEARVTCNPWLSHPEAGNRVAAINTLCDAARFDRTRLPELLELLISRKHEQDPVRAAFLRAVANLPPGRWEPEHLPALARLVRDALDAADLSNESISAIGRLLDRILPFHPEWAVGQLATVTAERGFPTWRRSDSFTVDEVRRIAPALTPVIRAWSDREREPAILELAQSVGRRLSLWPELCDALERLIRESANASLASSAMFLVIEQLPAARERIVTETLARDRSWVLNQEVLGYLNARRQDLLTPYLGHGVYSGRFSTGKVRHVLPIAAGFQRWTATQQETFADTLTELTAAPLDPDRQQVTADILFAVRRLAMLPAVGPERLVALARDPRPAVKEAAVRALGRFDARQGIPELLEALGDPRARFAVYALRAALRDLPPDRVLGIMRSTPLAKVTVAKEAVRLAGELGGAGCLGWFAELDDRPLHRDVRGALLRALWDHLERPEAWAILDNSAADPDPAVVIGLARIQVGRASTRTRERVANLLLRLLGNAEPTVRVAVLERLATLPVPDPSRVLLVASLGALGSAIPDERTSGLRAALALATDADADRFAAAFTGLLPRRQELATAVTEFATRTTNLGDRLVAVRSAVLAAVEVDPTCVLLQIRLASARLAMEPFARWVVKLTASESWHVGTQTAVAGIVAECGQPVEDLERAEAIWGTDADPALRWQALWILKQVAGSQGWTIDRRERLAHYRRDPSPAVAAEAAFTFPPDSPSLR